ncbi:MAG: 3-isopropylmalate dehydratase small subunit [Acidobacteria bacterium]|nr:3-isopropylmalate dehydratase small subunit [Acidobacteriota bacterium]
MEPVTRFRSPMVALPNRDVDTDQIIPARFLKGTVKTGLGKVLFADWRYLPDGSPKEDFQLNRPEAARARVLVAGDNFGCGSSREHAPWALLDYGIRAIISTSFADIFQNNALKNGLLPIVVDPTVHRELLEMASKHGEIEIDLPNQILQLPDGRTIGFTIEGFARRCLLDGVDQLGYLIGSADAISAYEATHEPRVSTL